MLRAIEHEAFTQYVDLLDRYERAVAAQAALDAGQPDLPMVVRGGNGVAMSLYIRIIDRTLAALLRLQSEFGFTPVSRARLGRPEGLPDPSDSDRWGELRHFPVIEGGKKR